MQAIVDKEKFLTPKTFEVSPHGIFGIKEKANGLKLTDVLIENGYVRFLPKDGGGVNAVMDYQKINEGLKKDPLLKQLSLEVEHLMELRKKYPTYISDLGPDNLIVKLTNEKPPKIEGVSLVDIGMSGPATRAKFDQADGFLGYLNVSEGLINRYIDTGVMKVDPKRITNDVCESLFIAI